MQGGVVAGGFEAVYIVSNKGGGKMSKLRTFVRDEKDILHMVELLALSGDQEKKCYAGGGNQG